MRMIQLNLTTEQAKFLLILTGSSAGDAATKMGIYQTLHAELGVFGHVPDPDISNGYSIVVSQQMLDRVKCEKV